RVHSTITHAWFLNDKKSESREEKPQRSHMSTYQENRSITAAERETILVYGVLVLLIGGGIGVYFPLLLDKSINAESLATYALAALAPLWTDILLPEKYWKSLSIRGRMRIGAACGFAALFSFMALVRNGKSFD